MTTETAPPPAARAALDRSSLFAALPADARDALACQFERHDCRAGEIVVREEDPGDRYYLIADGEAEVWVARGAGGLPPTEEPGTVWTPDPTRNNLQARLGPGDGFGEMALLQGGVRRATVRAASALVLYSVTGAIFRQTLDAHRGLAIGLEDELTLHETAIFLGKASPFNGLPPETLSWLALRLEPRELEPGEAVFCQGDVGDALYIVQRGSAAIYVVRDGVEQQVGLATAGEPFGEQALITGAPRTATVRAIGFLTVLRLSRDDFEQVLREHRERGNYFLQLTLQRQRPRRIAHWTMERQDERGGEPAYILKDTVRHRYLRLSEQGAFLWELMDGERNVRDLTLAYFTRYKTFGLDAVMGAMLQLNAAGFVQIQRIDARRLGQVAALNRVQRVGLRLLPWVTRYVALPDIDGLVTFIYRYLYRPLYTRPARWLLALISVLGGTLFVAALARGGLHLHATPTQVLVLSLVSLVVQGLLHESGHAVTCKHFGREVHRAGVGWYLFLPVAFVDTSDIWLSGKRARATVAFAGPYVNFILSGLAMLVLVPVQGGFARVALFQFAVTGYGIGLLNMNPLIEFDGYYVLMDWLEVPNLRKKALAFIGATLWRTGRTTRDGRLVRIFTVYGVLTLLYTLVMTVTILTGYHRYVEGAVGRVLPALLAVLLGWLIALLMAGLLLLRVWNEVRAGTRRAGRLPALAP